MNRAKFLTLLAGGAKQVAWYLAGGAPPPLGAWQAIGAADAAASYVNLVTPGTYNLTSATPPAFDTADGWTFDGSTHIAFDTGIAPNNQAWSYIVRYSDAADVTWKAVMGYSTTNASVLLYPQAAANTVAYYNGGSISIATKLLTGILAIAGSVAYRDGIAEAGAIADWSGVNTKKVFIGGIAAVAGSICKIQAAAIWNSVLTPAQVFAVYSRMAALPL